MHIVTKIMVILATILSVLLAGLAIAYTNNAQAIKGELRTERNRATAAEAQVGAVNAAAAADRESLQQKIATLEASFQESSSRLASIQGENARLLAEVNSLKQAQATHSGQIDQFTAVIQTYASLNKAQSDELEALRTKELEYARREIAITDRVNDLSSELEVSRETNRSLQEQLVALREQMDRGGSPGAPGSLDTRTTTGLRAPAGFQSRVTAVRRDASGQTLVEIAAGSSDRLREGMQLNIARTNTGYIATIVVERVNVNDAVARVSMLGSRGNVQAGDAVMPTSH